MNWSAVDNLNNGLSSFQNGAFANFNTSLVKGLPTGGVANITFQTNYQNLTNPPTVGAFRVINPLYTAPLTLGIEQPLWQNFGVGINQLLNQMPFILGTNMPAAASAYWNNTSKNALQQGPGFNGVPVLGILLTRLRFDEERAEFERHVNNLLVNVEAAYWYLYQAYGNLYAYEEVMRLSHKAWVYTRARAEAGQKASFDLASIRAQYEEFRGNRMQALGQVIEAERNLRGIIGLPVEDGTRLVPITAPTLAPYIPNWQAALDDALALRPELVLARQNLRTAQYSMVIQKNFLKPDFRFIANYQPTGFGPSLTGNGTFLDGNGNVRNANTFASLASDHYNSWNVGLLLNVPLGWRLEQASMRAARLVLAQSYYLLQDEEQRAERYLTQQYQKLNEWYRRIETSRAERKAYGQAVEDYFELIKAGQKNLADLTLLDFQRRFALAMLKEYESIAEYNNSLARFEYAKGTLMHHDNVSIAEGALPQCVQVRAVENERQRTRALILWERDSFNPETHPGWMASATREPPKELQVPAAGQPKPPDLPIGAPPRVLPMPMESRPMEKNTGSSYGRMSNPEPTASGDQEPQATRGYLLPGNDPDSTSPSEATTGNAATPPAVANPAGRTGFPGLDIGPTIPPSPGPLGLPGTAGSGTAGSGPNLGFIPLPPQGPPTPQLPR
jgi:outer membrane protein TolC